MSLSDEISNSAPGGTVERLSVEPVQSRPRRPALQAVETPPAPSQTLETPPPPPAAGAQQASLNAQVQAVFAAIARVLAVKLQLLLTLIAAFVLALGAMQWQSQMGLAVLIAWCVLAVLPMVWLDFASRLRRP